VTPTLTKSLSSGLEGRRATDPKRNRAIPSRLVGAPLSVRTSPVLHILEEIEIDAFDRQLTDFPLLDVYLPIPANAQNLVTVRQIGVWA
jgi:hypothetical protein